MPKRKITWNARDIRKWFKRANTWTFWVFDNKAQNNALIIIITAILIWGSGAIIFSIKKDFSSYSNNPLAYLSLVWILLALLAYWWYVKRFPELLAQILPAMEASKFTIKKRVNQKLSKMIPLMILLGIIVIIVQLIDLRDMVNLQSNWYGSIWFTGINRNAYIVFLIIVHGFLLGSILGSGVTGLILSAIILIDILKYPLNLVYYRRMKAVTKLSTELAGWAFIALFIVIGQSFSRTSILIAGGFLLLSISFPLVFIVLITPIYYAGKAIQNSREKKVNDYEKLLCKVDDKIYQLMTDTTYFSDLDSHASQLNTLRKEHQEILCTIKEIESIPNWPINIKDGTAILASVFTPFIAMVIEQSSGIVRSSLEQLILK